MIVKAAKHPADDTDHNYRNDIHYSVFHRHVAYIKHDEPTLAEQSTIPGVAVLNEGPEHYCDHGRAEEGTPQEGASPPRGHLLQGE